MSYVRNKPSISSEAAVAMIAAARAKAVELGVAMSIAVVDESGDLKAFDRMDDSVHVSIQLAQDKAFTAIGFGLSSDGWYDFIKDDGPLAMGAPAAIERLVTFGGGYPVVIAGAIVGGIGVSGGHYSQDMEVAQAGLKALE